MALEVSQHVVPIFKLERKGSATGKKNFASVFSRNADYEYLLPLNTDEPSKQGI